jgi:hypothetical protein
VGSDLTIEIDEVDSERTRRGALAGVVGRQPDVLALLLQEGGVAR